MPDKRQNLIIAAAIANAAMNSFGERLGDVHHAVVLACSMDDPSPLVADLWRAWRDGRMSVFLNRVVDAHHRHFFDDKDVSGEFDDWTDVEYRQARDYAIARLKSDMTMTRSETKRRSFARDIATLRQPA